MQIVRDELVVSLQILVGDIEINRSIFRFYALPQHVHRAFVALQKRRQDQGHKWFL